MARDSALSPGSSDALAAFAGHYAMHYLPEGANRTVLSGPNLAITVSSTGTDNSCPGGNASHKGGRWH